MPVATLLYKSLYLITIVSRLILSFSVCVKRSGYYKSKYTWYSAYQHTVLKLNNDITKYWVWSFNIIRIIRSFRIFQRRNLSQEQAMIQAHFKWFCQKLSNYVNIRKELGFPDCSAGKESPAMRKTWVRSLGWEDPLEKGKATHSSILAWRIPWTV